MFKLNRFTGAACVLMLLQAGLVGCQSGMARRDSFDNGVNRAPTPRTLLMMSRLLNENGRADQAEYVLLKVVDDHPLFMPAYIELADLQIRQKKFTEAVETLSRAHEMSPRDAVIANNLGVLLLRGQDHAAASGVFRSAIETDPQEARYRANLALSLGMQGEYREAYEMYTSVVSPSEAYWNIGVISETRSDMQQASAFFTRSHRLAKGDADPGFSDLDGEATVSVSVD